VAGPLETLHFIFLIPVTEPRKSRLGGDCHFMRGERPRRDSELFLHPFKRNYASPKAIFATILFITPLELDLA